MVVLFKNVTLHHSSDDSFSCGVIASICPSPQVPPIEIAFDCADDASRWYTSFSALDKEDKHKLIERFFNIINFSDMDSDSSDDKSASL